MAEFQSLSGKAKFLADAAEMPNEVLETQLTELATHYLPEAVSERGRQEVQNLMTRISFELSMRGVEASDLVSTSSVA